MLYIRQNKLLWFENHRSSAESSGKSTWKSKFIISDDMQFGFMSGCGTTDVIFIVTKLEERFLDKNEKLCFHWSRKGFW